MANAGTVSVAFKATGLGKFKTEADRAAQSTEGLAKGFDKASTSATSFGQAAAKAGKLGAGMAAAATGMALGIGKAASSAGRTKRA